MMEEELVELTRRWGGPVHWGKLQSYIERVYVGDAALMLAGLQLSRIGDEMTASGSAAEMDGSPVRRAYAELLERVCVLDAAASERSEYLALDEEGRPKGSVPWHLVFPKSPDPARWRFALSNGVALASDWPTAFRRARQELVERDRVLRAWYGQIRPQAVEMAPPDPHGLDGLYSLTAHRFGASEEGQCEVAGVFAWPRSIAHPFAYGFAAAPGLSTALEGAWRECRQRLGFLWGEDLPTTPPAVGPEPDCHQEFYLFPWHVETIRRWLYRDDWPAVPLRGASGFTRTVAVDLTPEWLAPHAFVAKAVPVTEMPLTFGCGHPWLAAGVPALLQVHPIV